MSPRIAKRPSRADPVVVVLALGPLEDVRPAERGGLPQVEHVDVQVALHAEDLARGGDRAAGRDELEAIGEPRGAHPLGAAQPAVAGLQEPHDAAPVLHPVRVERPQAAVGVDVHGADVEAGVVRRLQGARRAVRAELEDADGAVVLGDEADLAVRGEDDAALEGAPHGEAHARAGDRAIGADVEDLVAVGLAAARGEGMGDDQPAQAVGGRRLAPIADLGACVGTRVGAGVERAAVEQARVGRARVERGPRVAWSARVVGRPGVAAEERQREREGCAGGAARPRSHRLTKT